MKMRGTIPSQIHRFEALLVVAGCKFGKLGPIAALGCEMMDATEAHPASDRKHARCCSLEQAGVQ
jgi:hypothetical protein